MRKFKNSFFFKYFGIGKKQLEKLIQDVNSGVEKDEKKHELALEKYVEELKNWDDLQNIADGIEQNNPKSYHDALTYFNPFADIGELGSQVGIKITDKCQIELDVYVNDKEIIPDYELKLLASGKLSKKKMTKSKFNELYQDYVCSALIRVSRELFSYLPLDKVNVNAIGKILNTKTGYIEDKVIVSTLMIEETIGQLNLDKIDPSDSMENFIHNMNFSKLKGFKPVERIEITD